MCDPVATGAGPTWTLPAHERIPHRIFADCQTRRRCTLLQPRPRAQILLGEDHACHRRRLRVRYRSQLVDFPRQPLRIDFIFPLSLQWMPIPVFIDQVFCRSLSPGAPNHLRAYGAIQMKSLAVTGCQSCQPVNAPPPASAAMLHRVNLDHAQRRAG